MGWEQRNGRAYFYLKRRNGKRVVSEYLGGGPVIEGFAQDIAGEQELERTARQRWQAQRQAVETADRELREAAEVLRRAVAVLLHGAGLHQHNGTWRRKRHG